MDAAVCRALIHRYYDELWNEWRLDLIDELLAPGVHFRGSLGTTLEGREAFRGYMLGIRQALPDLHHEVEMLVVEEDAAAARLAYLGTHEGDLLGIPGSGQQISYHGATFFHLADGLIAEMWTLGDMSAVRRQLLGTPNA